MYRGRSIGNDQVMSVFCCQVLAQPAFRYRRTMLCDNQSWSRRAPGGVRYLFLVPVLPVYRCRRGVSGTCCQVSVQPVCRCRKTMECVDSGGLHLALVILSFELFQVSGTA